MDIKLSISTFDWVYDDVADKKINKKKIQQCLDIKKIERLQVIKLLKNVTNRKIKISYRRYPEFKQQMQLS